MYYVTWYSKATGGLCEWEAAVREEAVELCAALQAQGITAAMDSEPDPFFPGMLLADLPELKRPA